MKLKEFIGKSITVFCMNYIYAGILDDVDDVFIVLKNAAVVYVTGPFNNNHFTEAEKLPHRLYISIRSVESVTMLKAKV
jgi:hypothetical protein